MEKGKTPLNIYQKMSLIENEIGIISKAQEVQITKTRSFKGVGYEDIKKKFQPLEEKHGIKSIDIKKEVLKSETIVTKTDYGEKSQHYIEVRVTRKYINLDNPSDFCENQGVGIGMGNDDKGPGKAETYALKNATISAYNIITGEETQEQLEKERLEKEAKHFIELANKMIENATDDNKLQTKIKKEATKRYMGKENVMLKIQDGAEFLQLLESVIEEETAKDKEKGDLPV
jgi:hypothetical protein